MSKVKLGSVPLVYPIPIVLVGVTIDRLLRHGQAAT